jgi:hypothetical protein
VNLLQNVTGGLDCGFGEVGSKCSVRGIDRYLSREPGVDQRHDDRHDGTYARCDYRGESRQCRQ